MAIAAEKTDAFWQGQAQDADHDQWMNPPKQWRRSGQIIDVTADPKTDFWRKT
jgi:hypothetical protein